MNYEKIIDRTLRLQSKIIKACGREFGSLKSFNSKYSLSHIDFENKTAKFDLLLGKKGENSLTFSFELVEIKGYGTHHIVKATLTK